MTGSKIFKIVIGIGVIALGVIISQVLPPTKSDYYKPDSQLLTLTSILIDPPVYLKQPKKTSGKYALRLNLAAYPGVYFDNEHEFLKATDMQQFLRNAKLFDTVSIKVSKQEFTKYYLKRDSLSTFQKFAHPQTSYPFYSLIFENKEYVGDIYLAALKERDDKIVSRVVIGMLFMLGGLLIVFFAK